MITSFIVPVYNTDYRILRICINSILHALTDEHELVIVDDASTNSNTLEFLRKCLHNNSHHITVIVNKENSGVSYSLNKGIATASGDYIAPVDHDDLIIPSGFDVALKHIEYFRAPWVYTNEIQIDAKGYLIRHLQKPKYSKQLLRSIMYINHLQVFSKELFQIIGGYRDGLEGSQDHDLALRMTEKVEPLHIPSLAYQWRIMKETQSRHDWQVSEDSIKSSMHALSDHFSSIGKTATIETAAVGLSVYKSRVTPSVRSSISIIIPCRIGTTREIDGNNTILLEHCLQSIKNTTETSIQSDFISPDIELILIINQDDDQTVAEYLLQKYDFHGKVERDSFPFNFSRKCNLGGKLATGEILVFLNDDTKFLTNSWTNDVVSLLLEDDVACVGGMLLNPDGTVQSCGDMVGLGSATHYEPYPDPTKEGDPMHRYCADHETTSITGAFLCCRKDLFLKYQGFNEVFNNSFQDVDFCLRVRSDHLRCLISPHIKIIHYESSSRNPAVDIETLAALRSFHHPIISLADEYALWAYQPVPVSWKTIAGLLHIGIQFRSKVYSILRSIRRLSPYPRERFVNLIE